MSDREPLKGRQWTPAELLDLARRRNWVHVDVAIEIIGGKHTSSYDNIRDTGFLDFDRIVSVRRVTAHRFKVPISDLLRWAKLDEGSPLGPRLTHGETTEEARRPWASSVSVPNNTPAKGEVRVNHSIRTGGA